MLKNYNQALNDLDKALKIDPDNVFAPNGRGETRRMLKSYNEALIDLTRP